MNVTRNGKIARWPSQRAVQVFGFGVLRQFGVSGSEFGRKHCKLARGSVPTFNASIALRGAGTSFEARGMERTQLIHGGNGAVTVFHANFGVNPQRMRFSRPARDPQNSANFIIGLSLAEPK